MSDLLLNLNFETSGAQKAPSRTNAKHKRFLKRRPFLERRGYLKQLGPQGHQQVGRPQSSNSCSQRRWKFGERDQEADSFLQPQASKDHRPGKNRELFNNVQPPNIALPAPKPQKKGFNFLGVQTNEKPRQILNLQEGAADSGIQWKPSFQSGTTTAANGNSTSLWPASSFRGHLIGGSSGVKQQPAGLYNAVSLLSEYESGLSGPWGAGKPHKFVAIDCEMVGTGQNGSRSELARCSIVNYHGDVVYDKYILPLNPVFDYRTRWSGIRKHHLRNATPFKVAQKEILKILAGKVVVGHAIHNDFKALSYFHPQELTRDTSKMPLLNKQAGFTERETVSLKRLTKQLLKKDIQV
nr:PREDICTED: interferon-stimulated 20 kDa exonuclease-like 2 isoform X2 [Latimeria chalumnae]|eukprot:XP_005991721.1 PREDICTED: interferon-stimulated 20 kDa exonuclease-like 2 isoform X2 [Latimeria chalumnae]